MDEQHPITPPPELVQEWWEATQREKPERWVRHVATQAARWGADTELEACCEWLGREVGSGWGLGSQLRAARRPPTIPETIEVDGHIYRLVK